MVMTKIKTIGVLTSGGDAPGMNAAIRAVTRSAIYAGLRVFGIYRGFNGLINGDVKEFTTESVSGIIFAGGTILLSARSKEFLTPEGRAKAYKTIKSNGIDALIVIGGNGSLSGAQALSAEYDIPVIGLPCTIDNDLYGTDNTIGFDTALNTIVECVDKIHDTANSHNRIFFVEVMGRDAGFLAMNSAIAAGAEAAIIPESSTNIDQLAAYIDRGIRKSKRSSIVLVSEKDGGAMHYAERMYKEYPEFDVRVSILGYLQRGGRPSAMDRILASRMGVAAIEALKEGQRNIMIGVVNDQMVNVPIARAVKKDKPINEELINVLSVLSI
jgi:6-phosphofructokinase 1